MSWVKHPNQARRYREAVADSGSFDSFRLFIFGSFSVVGNLESLPGQHFLPGSTFWVTISWGS